MTLPYAAMNDQEEGDVPSKQTGTNLWRKWRPNLKPRLNRRRSKRPSPSTAFPTPSMNDETTTINTPLDQQEEKEPSSPPLSPNLEIDKDHCSTPRSSQAPSILDDSSSLSLTPPTSTFPPPSLAVSAKRLGSQVRRNHSKRRKGGRMWGGGDKENSSNSSSLWSDSEEEEEEALPPVQHLSPAEQSQCYWKWCYGDTAEQSIPQNSWSASRAPPGKSCLSSRKAPPTISTVSIETPTMDRLSTSMTTTTASSSTTTATIPPSSFETPSNTPPDGDHTKMSCSHTKSVQFGMAQAAEYELDGPPVEMTPMPMEICQERFPLVQRVQQEEEEEKATAETKSNTATLAEWEDYLNDDDDESSSDGDDEMQFVQQSRRRSRRSSGFFSPPDATSASLLLPAEHSDDVDCDLMSTDVNMASLAVRSPLNLEDTSVETGRNLLNDSSSMDTTPPSDIQLGTVHSTGGALLADNNEANPINRPPIISSRQLHGALERVAKDENDIVMMLLQNPSLEMDWPTAQLLRTMARHSNAMAEGGAANTCDKEDAWELFKSLQAAGCIRKHLMKEMERYIFEVENLKVVEGDSQPTMDANIAQVLTSWERQKLELASLDTLLKHMQELGVATKRELVVLQKLVKSQRLVMKRRQAAAVHAEEQEVAALQVLVQAERAERDLAMARLRHQETFRDLLQAAPYSVVQCLALSKILPFSLESVSPTRVDVSFSCSAAGPRPCIQWDKKDGISSHVLPEAICVMERSPTIESDHVASIFYRTFMFADRGQGHQTVHPPVLQHVHSSDVSQTVLSMSLLMGRMHLAIVDLTKVMSKFYVGNILVERKSDSLVILCVSFLDKMHVHFYYDAGSEKSLAHVIPSRVRVIQGGIRMESLEADALQTLRESSAPCLERICDAFFLASCM